MLDAGVQSVHVITATPYKNSGCAGYVTVIGGNMDSARFLFSQFCSPRTIALGKAGIHLFSHKL